MRWEEKKKRKGRKWGGHPFPKNTYHIPSPVSQISLVGQQMPIPVFRRFKQTTSVKSKPYRRPRRAGNDPNFSGDVVQEPGKDGRVGQLGVDRRRAVGKELMQDHVDVGGDENAVLVQTRSLRAREVRTNSDKGAIPVTAFTHSGYLFAIVYPCIPDSNHASTPPPTSSAISDDSFSHDTGNGIDDPSSAAKLPLHTLNESLTRRLTASMGTAAQW